MICIQHLSINILILLIGIIHTIYLYLQLKRKIDSDVIQSKHNEIHNIHIFYINVEEFINLYVLKHNLTIILEFKSFLLKVIKLLATKILISSISYFFPIPYSKNLFIHFTFYSSKLYKNEFP